MAIFSGVKAAGTWTVSASHLADAETLAIGGITYRFKTTMAQAYDVYLPAGGNDAADVALVANLIKAINASGTAGTEYYAGTLKHKMVKAAAGGTARIMVVTDVTPGASASDPLYSWSDFGQNETASGGGTFTYDWSGSGVVGTLTATDAAGFP